MNFFILTLVVMSSVVSGAGLNEELGLTYIKWRNAMVKRDYRTWTELTAKYRQLYTRNRIYSEKRKYPEAIFEIPVPPPSLRGLKALQFKANESSAVAVYLGDVYFFGKQKIPQSLLVLRFIKERLSWKYDYAEVVNLGDMPKIKEQLYSGNKQYLKQQLFEPLAKEPPLPKAVKPAQYIAKVYAFCPYRKVNVTINKVSNHQFVDDKDAQLVMGGVYFGKNRITYTIQDVEGGSSKEPIAIRVYIMSTVKGVQPAKVFEYLINPEGVVNKGKVVGSFEITQDVHNKIEGK